ncbi:ATP-binding protein [Williamsia deligens]|uniref:ATP-binding protein n=1 Tax=Williamsia deligens TaxID=321325 RepID=A0ABW3G4M1_9NOCA|nr:AAA family ATPase [Williamsia deligens]MCP2194272.1 AAA ATPase domain-containing protein [Williamsia deligens]
MLSDTAAVAIRLVGGVRIVHGGVVVHPRVVGGPRCAEVLAYLAVRRDRDVALEDLADVLWPGVRPRSWNAAVRGVLSRVRDSLEIAGVAPENVRSRGGFVRMTLPPGMVTDLEFATDLIVPVGADPVDVVRDVRTVLGLLDGPVLPDVTGAWTDEVRTTVAGLRQRALEIDAEMSLQVADHEHAVAAAERLIAADPLRENAYRVAMSAHVAMGERGRALEVAARCRAVLADELGVTPSVETEELFLTILRSGDGEAPVTRPVERVELIGRAPELATIADIVDRAGRGTGQTIVVTGEAGSGKSTIAAEAMHRARERGIHVLHGRCSEEAVVPFEPLVEAISDELGGMDVTDARARVSEVPGLAHLIPLSVRRLGLDLPGDRPDDDRSVAMTAVFDWLVGPGRSGATMLVIDDLHWATPATLAVLRWIIRASERRRLCVLATIRDEYLDSPGIRAMTGSSGHRDSVHRIVLGGLTPAEVGAIVEASGSRLDPSVLHERTHGLPLFVDSLIASQRSGLGAALPTSIAESVSQRERLLGPAAVDLLQICAVVGMSTRRDVLRAATPGLDDPAFADALDELERHRLVRESDSGSEVELRHPLVQEAVYAGITGGRRSALHSRVAQVLEELDDLGAPDDCARLAYHLSRGFDGDRRRAADLWWRAGDGATSLGAYEDGVAFYRSAAERLLPRGDSADRCRLQVDLGRALRKARDPDFRPTLLGAADMARRLGDVDLQVRATLANDLQGILYVHFHSDADRIADLYDALDALEAAGRDDGATTAHLLSQLAIELIWVSDHSTRRDLLVRAIDAARGVGDRGALIAALSALLVALRVPQCADLRRASYDELTGLLSTSTERRVDPLMAVWIARQQVEYGDLRAAQRTTSYLTAAQADRDPEMAWLSRSIEFAIDLAAGRLVRAEERLEGLQDIPSSPIESFSFGRVLGHVMALRALRGDMREVADERAALIEHLDVVDIYRASLAAALVDVGEIDAARRYVDWYDRSRIDKIPVNTLWLITLAAIGRVAAQVGNAEVCALVYERIEPYRDENTITWASVYGTVHHHLGQLSITVGEYARATAHLEDALAAHRDQGFDGWYAETQYLVALLEHRRDGQPSAESLLRARRAAEEVGATAVLRRIGAIGS